MINIDVELDCKNMFCPMPIVQLNKTTKNMSNDQIIRLLATDPGSVRDVPAWADKTGNTILETSQNKDVYEFIIQVN
jgi:tRNA 2-thiouridine synthesizing protein A